MLASVNDERKKAGLNTVCYSWKLEEAALSQSTWNAVGRAEEGRSLDQDIADGTAKGEDAAAIAHRGRGGSELSDRGKEAGYDFSIISENVAWGQPDVAGVMKDWINSPGHKANILTTDNKHAGFASVKDNTGIIHWTQVFGASADDCNDPTD
jgi:uncharacterized protein YkwD